MSWHSLSGKRPFWTGFLGMIVALCLVVVAYHLWMDHAALHALFARAVAENQARQTAPK
jgi:hypothetical protein